MKDGNRYLQMSRPNDKLIPKVQKGFEENHRRMIKIIEDNNHELQWKIKKSKAEKRLSTRKRTKLKIVSPPGNQELMGGINQDRESN